MTDPVPLDPRVDALARKLIYWDWDNLENSESSRNHPRGHARELLAVVDAVDPVRAELGAARAELAEYVVEYQKVEAALGAARTALAQVREVHRNHEASVDGYELWRDLGVALSLAGSVPTVQGEAKLPQNSVPVITEEPR